MRYLLDTNVCVIYLKGRNLNLKQRLEAIPTQEIGVCSIVKAELCFGAMKSTNPERNFALQQTFLAQFISLPFDDLASTTFGVIRAQLETKGLSIGAYDLQIAALAKLSEGIALVNNLTLVTHNTREFGRVDGLLPQQWIKTTDGEKPGFCQESPRSPLSSQADRPFASQARSPGCEKPGFCQESPR